MATGSKGGRSYSDPSYGSIKLYSFPALTAGTRATAIAQAWKPMNPITIVDWQITNNATGTGGTSQWKLVATSAEGTSELGAISMTGTHGVGAIVDGTATETKVSKDGAVHLYSVLSTAADLSVIATVSYRERFVQDDN